MAKSMAAAGSQPGVTLPPVIVSSAPRRVHAVRETPQQLPHGTVMRPMLMARVAGAQAEQVGESAGGQRMAAAAAGAQQVQAGEARGVLSIVARCSSGQAPQDGLVIADMVDRDDESMLLALVAAA